MCKAITYESLHCLYLYYTIQKIFKNHWYLDSILRSGANCSLDQICPTSDDYLFPQNKVSSLISISSSLIRLFWWKNGIFNVTIVYLFGWFSRIDVSPAPGMPLQVCFLVSGQLDDQRLSLWSYACAACSFQRWVNVWICLSAIDFIALGQ